MGQSFDPACVILARTADNRHVDAQAISHDWQALLPLLFSLKFDNTGLHRAV